MRKLVLVIAAAMVPAALLALALIGYDSYQRRGKGRAVRALDLAAPRLR